MELQTDILVVGAGLTGLTTAHYLQKNNRSFLVVEQASHVGGAIQTGEENGFIFEKGPSTGVMNNEIVREVFDDLSSLCTLEWAANSVNKRFILKNNRWQPLPNGVLGGITTPLFKFSDKLRLLTEPFRKPGTNPNETLDQLVKRRMGKSFLDYAVDPFILGVYAGDPSYLVPRFALPKLYQLEQNYGSFIGGSVKMQLEKRKLKEKKPPKQPHRIFSAKGGLHNLTHALMKSAGEEKFLLGIQQLSLVPTDNNHFKAEGILPNGEKILIQANQIITTTGASSLHSLLPFVENHLLNNITNLRYAKVVQVAVGFNHWLGTPIDGFGGLIPSKENKQLLGVLYPSAFLSHRAPVGGALLSIFLGGVRHPEVFDMPDDAIRHLIGTSLQEWMGLKSFNPDLFQVFRYQEAIPQYGADCEARFITLDRLQQQFPSLHIGGNLRGGIGMADRIKQGKQLANEILG
jgi:oxygen-dependent protoporphyrinogen oxidase